MTNPDGSIIPFTGFSNLPLPSDHTMLSLSAGKEALTPITESPIRFAVFYRNGCMSNAWGVKVEDTGDAYIYCRDNMAGQKVSLHASGKQHISLDPNPAANISHKEFMNQWHEPKEGIPTLRLIFPYWGVQLKEDQMIRDSVWNKNGLFIEGHHEFLTVVSFFIVNEKAVMTKTGGPPVFLMGELPLTPGKKLGITAGWEPDNGFKTKVKEALSQAANGMSEEALAKTNVLCLMGWNEPNSAFMTTIPVTYKKKRL